MKWDFFLNKSKKIVPDALSHLVRFVERDEMFFLFLRKAC